ncbi:MCE family protein [Mycolicibacterium sp. BiH015]|uniref:MCE family protein n=1 Tax=Mycolicibacterium sp. BiH015 TaxID=3018808 RepID=UPI0022E2CEC6|nr:MCE family protein [Mycolicibacterium sp. BiH015]MDA2893254.1 MCE family protein [Mycolicibacterium sp. BiH015]
MRQNLVGVVWRLAIFAVVCVTGAFALIAIYAQLRFAPQRTYHAVFESVSGLEPGNFVRIAGVEVGKISGVRINDDATALVTFSTDESVVLTEGTQAAIRYADLIGGRYLALEEGTGPTTILAPGGTIPDDKTAPALDLDALIGGFRPLFRALDPDQVNALSSQLIGAFQGQGPTISSVLSQTAALTSTLADRDVLIGQVIVNLNTVLGSLGKNSDQLGTAVESLSELMNGLAARRDDLANTVAYANEAAGSISDLLTQARPPLQKVVTETDRTAATVLADHAYFDDLLKTLPDAYRALGRQALNGDFFSFYLCDIIVKVNGKGGQPVFIKLAGQDTGRCTPR